MATELKGVWSLTEVKKSGVVTSKTASYKIGTKEVIKLTNLSPSLTKDETDGTIAGLTVDDENKTLTLSGSALNKATVAFTSSTYTLELDNVPAVEFTDIQPTVASGKVTFKSPLSAGYTLSANGKTLTYSEAKTDPQELATVSELATTVTTENVDETVRLDDGVITLSPDALKQAKVSLSLKNGAAYTLAIDSDVDKIETEPDGDWSYSKGTATLKGTVTKSGYAVAPDGKSVNFLKENAKTANLATVKGLNESYDAIDCATSVDENGNYVITLPEEALNSKDVTISGTGFALELDSDVPTSETVEKTDEWAVSGTTATYKQVMPAHYDLSAGKIAYTKAADVQTYAKLTGLKKGLEASGETVQDGSGNDVITVEDKVITLTEGALDKGVTLTSDDYSLELDDVQGAVIEEGSGKWSLSGKNGGIYKAKITEGGWGLKDDHTVTYTAAANSAVVGTITGLKTGVTVAELTGTEADPENDIEEVVGIVVDTDGTFTIPKALLTNTDVVLTNGNGFSYELATDAPDSGENVHSWGTKDVTNANGDVTSATANLYYGKSAYYVASEDKKTLTYNEPKPGSSVATIQFLKGGISADDLPTDEEITQDSKKKYTIPLSGKVLTTKTATLTGTGYALALDDEDGALSAKDNQLLWNYVDNKKNDTTATLISYKTEGWAANSAGTQITYTAPVKGATLATLKGVKSGLKTAGEDVYEEVGDTTKTRVYNNFLSGITVYTEKTTENEETANEKEYAANTIAIEKAAVVDKITLTSSAYNLAVGKDLTESVADPKWTFDENKKTATYTYQTPAGYTVEKSGTTTTFNVEKASKLTATLTGLDISEKAAIEALAVNNDDHVITLTDNVLNDATVTVKGNYTLAVDGIDEPELGDPTWDMSKKGTAVLKGAYSSAGYTLDTKATTLTYTEADDDTKVTLATVSGLNTIAKQEDTSGLEVDVDDKTIVLSSTVLNKAKITIKSDYGYEIALDETDDDIPTGPKDEVEWVVSGTTANYQSYTKGYYSPEIKNNAPTGAIAYTPDKNATTKATVNGLLKGTTSADLNDAFKDNTLTLTADMLGTAKVTLTDKDTGGYKLALDGEVLQAAKEFTEWVNSGTKATYQTYTRAYYTLEGKTISYTKPGKATVHLTLSGVQGEVTDANLNTSKTTVTLNADQLNHTKNKVTTKLTTSKEAEYANYKIAFASTVTNVPDSGDATWITDGKGKANYVQPVPAETFVLDSAGTTVTYYDTETELTLATLSGVNKNITDADFNGGSVTVKGNVITLTDDVLKTDDDDKSTKVSVSKGYTLKLSGVEPTTEDLGWDFSTLEKSGTVTKNNRLGAGYVLDKNATSVSFSAAKDKSPVITLSGLNKKYSGGQTAAEAGITVDDTENTVILSNADLLTTSKITLKNGTGASYTLDVDESSLGVKDLEPDTAVWTIKSAKATLSIGTSAYYVQDSKSATTVNYVKEVASTPIATLDGLGKNAKVDGGKLGTITNKVFTPGVFIREGGTDADTGKETYTVVIAPEVLGTSDVVLKDETTEYKFNLSDESLTAPDVGEMLWKYDASKGAATLYQSVVAGWTLNSTTNTLEYTKGQDNAVLTTFSGLSKTFNEGEFEIEDALTTPTGTDDKITVLKASLLGTGTASLRNSKDYKYTLELGDDIPDKDDAKEEETNWITSGTKASYKTYNPAYYSINDKGAIVYNKAKDVSGKLYAEVSGIAKDVDINDVFKNNVITLGADQLTNKTVTLTNKTVDSVTSEFTLALGNDSLKAKPEAEATWVNNNSTTANLTASVSAGFTASSDGTKLTYTNDQSKAVLAVIKGLKNKSDLDGETFQTSSKTISPKTENLSAAVTIDGKETYAFSFDSEYTGKITGAATADTITAAGDSVTIAAGTGNDVITVKGTGASIYGGKGNDTINSNGKENVFYFAAGEGDDVIANFAPAKDKIMTNAKANVIAVESKNGNAVITIGAGTKSVGTVTLTGKGTSVSSISIVDTKGNAITPSYKASSDVLLADDNYSQDAAALGDITDAFHASYTPYDFESGLDLVKKDSFTPVVSYTGDDK